MEYPQLTGKRRYSTAGFVAAAVVGSAAALATLPAMDEDLFCNSTHAVVGKVVDAVLSDPAHVDAFCGHIRWNCTSGYISSCQDDPHTIRLHIKVLQVLGSTHHTTFEPSPWYTHAELVKVSAGDTIDVAIAVFNNVCQPGIEDHQGMLSINPPAKGATPAESLPRQVLRNLYVGRKYIFAIDAIRLTGVSDNAPFFTPPGAFEARAWKMDRRAWAVDTLKRFNGNSCPNPLRK